MPQLATAETRTLLEQVSWETFLELAEDRRGSVPRMTFDQGVLELMTPRRQHESIGCLIGRLVETYSEVRGIEILSCGSTTFKRPDLARAFEPDESYYIAHADEIRPKEEVDLLIDPPPDLVIEVEITSSAIAKLGLFAAMGVPEVWRQDGRLGKQLRGRARPWLSCLGSLTVRSLNLPRSALKDDCRRNSSRGCAGSRLSISKETQGSPS